MTHCEVKHSEATKSKEKKKKHFKRTTTRDLRRAVSVEGEGKQEVAQHFIANVTASKSK